MAIDKADRAEMAEWLETHKSRARVRDQIKLATESGDRTVTVDLDVLCEAIGGELKQLPGCKPFATFDLGNLAKAIAALA